MAKSRPLMLRWRGAACAWLLFVGSLGASQSNDPLKLFGIGMHTELREPIYIGLLFAPTDVKDLNSIKASGTPKRMTLKFVSRYSSRQMARMWKQRIALNSAKELWQPLTQEILTFADLFYQPMQAGDEVELVYKPASGTDIYLNKTLFLNIAKENFFDSLLNTWLGKIPATEEFKNGISGNNPDELIQKLIAQYDEIEVQVGRFVQKKTQTTVQATRVAQVQARPPTISKNEKRPKRQLVSNKAVNKAPKVVSEPTNAAISTPKSKPKSQSKPKPKPRPKAKPKVKPKPKPKPKPRPKAEPRPATTPLSDPKPTAKASPVVKPKASEKVARLDLNDADQIIDIDLMSGSFAKELVDKIIQLQTYPVRAMVDRAEGNAIAKVTIDKEGDLIDSELVQRTRNKLLNRAVIDMIRRAAPFPPIPEAFGLKEFEFNVPVRFKLVDRKKRKKRRLKRNE